MNKFVTFLFLMLMYVPLTYSQWSEQISPVTTLLYSVSAVNNNVAWACGASGKVLRTTNGGTTWDTIPSPVTVALYNIWGIDGTTALVTGSPSETFVFKTTNSGNYWAQVFIQPGGFIDAITSDPSLNKWFMMGDPVPASGGRWSLWKSTNNGSTWDSTGLYLPGIGSEAGWNNSLAMIYTGYSLRVWFGTSASRVYYGYGVGNANPTWTQQPTTGLTQSTAIWFNDSTRGMVGGGTFLQKTTNSGVLWTPITGIPGTGSITGITGAGNDWWYVRGAGVYYSADNGTTWSTDYTAPAGAYQHISKSRTGSYMWAVRSLGGISRSLGPFGIQPISNEIPVNYVLHQNYPNPFNPSTSIKFELPKSSSVELVIYDALGREAATVVNEELKAGIYEVRWDAEGFASGIYYYKLIAGDYSSTMKMVLVK